MYFKHYLSSLLIFSILSFHSLFSEAQESIEQSNIFGKKVYAKLEEAKKDCEEAMGKGDSSEVAEASYRMGKRYLDLGDFYTAQKCLTRALRILEPLGPSENLGKVYIFMTNFFLRNDQYDEAMQLVQKARINAQNLGSPELIMGAYISLGSIHYAGNEAKIKSPGKFGRYSIDSALHYHAQADSIGKSLKKITYRGNIIFSNRTNLVNNDSKSTIKYLKSQYNISLKQRASNLLFIYAASLGSQYLSISDFIEAKNWLDTASYIADTSNTSHYDQRIDLIKIYIQLNKQTRNWEEVLKYYEQYHELTLKAISADRDGAVSRLKIEYDTQKKEAELKEQEKFTKIAIVIGVFALLTSIIFFWFFRKYRIISRQNAALVSEQNHRVKNNLQQVINLLSLQSSRLDDDTAKKALVEALLRIEAVSLVHHRLYDGARLIEIELSSFIPELVDGILRSYNYDGIRVDYQIDNSWLHVEQALPLGLIINELVTNSCKYAFPCIPDPHLSIHCHEKAKQIILDIADNGPGFDHSTEKKTFGLKLIQLFAEKLKGKSGFDSKGTSFSLSFHKQTNKVKKNMTHQHA